MMRTSLAVTIAVYKQHPVIRLGVVNVSDNLS